MDDLMFSMLVLATLVFSIILVATGIFLEKKQFNNGRCKRCGKRLKLVRTSFLGNRIYSCGLCGCWVQVSYNCVDNKYNEEETDIIARHCRVCKHRQKMSCPNTSLCMCTNDKPYFEAIDE